MVTIAQLKTWKPEKLSSLADTLNVHRRELTYLQDELDEGKPPKSWIGGDASAATNQHNRIAADLYDNVAELVGVINALDAAEPDITAAKELLDTALQRAQGNGFDVSPTGVVTNSKPYHSRFEAEEAGEVMRGIANDISDALEKATQADADLAAALNRAQADQFDATGNLTSMSVESDLRSMTPQEQADYLTEHPDLLKAMGPTLSPEIQELIADKAAGDFKDHDVDPKTVEVIAALSKEPAFAKRLFDQVPLGDLEETIQHINEEAYPGGQVSSRADDDDVKAYKDFLSATGAAYATYTKGTGEYAPPADLVDQWGKAIESGNDGEGAALTLLLRAGGQSESFDTDFIAPLTDRIYDWEKSQDGPVWSVRDPNHVVDPFLTTDDQFLSNDGGYSYASDGMANLLGAMKNSPHAAQDFFMSDDGGVDQDKMKYLVTERTFSGDRYSDEGDGLGAALSAAAMGDKDHEEFGDHPGVYRDEWSAKFSSDLFHTIAEKSGTGDDFGPDDVWHIWPGMTDDLGGVAASYAGDIYDTIDVGASEGGPANLSVSGSDLDKVLGEIGRGDKTGIETLNAAIVLEGNERTSEDIARWQEEHPGVPLTLDAATAAGLDTELAGRGERNGEVLGHILNKSVLVDMSDEEIAKQRAEYTSKAIDMASGFIPGAGTVLGEGASEGAKALYDLGKGEVIDQLKDQVAKAPDATSGEYIKEGRDSMPDQIRYNMVNQLINNGYLTDGQGNSTVPDSLLVEGPNGTRVLNPTLYDADGIDGIGKKDEYTSAQQAQMRADWVDFTKHHPDANRLLGITAQGLDAFDRELNKS
ncbi:hypothetical protein ABTZ46_19905 [Nocardioides sp. NPDC126508]